MAKENEDGVEEDKVKEMVDEKNDKHDDAQQKEHNIKPQSKASSPSPSRSTSPESLRYGAPIHGLGVKYYSEMMLPIGYEKVVDWLQEVAAGMESGDETFLVPEVMYFGGEDETGIGEMVGEGVRENMEGLKV